MAKKSDFYYLNPRDKFPGTCIQILIKHCTQYKTNNEKNTFFKVLT